MIYQVEIERHEGDTERRTVRMRKANTTRGVLRQLRKIADEIHSEVGGDALSVKVTAAGKVGP